MDDVKIARITGVCGLACVALTFGQFPLRLVGSPPSVYDGRAFAITGLFLGSAAWATFDSRVLPRWTGWIAVASAALCAASVPAMYGGPADLYNAGSWGPAIVANFPPMIWFLTVSVVLIRRPGIGHGMIVRAA